MIDEYAMCEKYVTPFYQNCLWPENYPNLLREYAKVANEIDDKVIDWMYNDESGWREFQTASWICAIRKDVARFSWIKKCLVESRFCYAGKMHAFYMLRIGNTDAFMALTEYLERWLPQIDKEYDQVDVYAMYSILNEKYKTKNDDIVTMYKNWVAGHKGVSGDGAITQWKNILSHCYYWKCS